MSDETKTNARLAELDAKIAAKEKKIKALELALAEANQQAPAPPSNPAPVRDLKEKPRGPDRI
jgi:hypothetical protein